MERFVADERTGLKYELVGDYYLIAGDDEPETPSPWITPLQMSSFFAVFNLRKLLYII